MQRDRDIRRQRSTGTVWLAEEPMQRDRCIRTGTAAASKEEELVAAEQRVPETERGVLSPLLGTSSESVQPN